MVLRQPFGRHRINIHNNAISHNGLKLGEAWLPYSTRALYETGIAIIPAEARISLRFINKLKEAGVGAHAVAPMITADKSNLYTALELLPNDFFIDMVHSSLQSGSGLVQPFNVRAGIEEAWLSSLGFGPDALASAPSEVTDEVGSKASLRRLVEELIKAAKMSQNPFPNYEIHQSSATLLQAAALYLARGEYPIIKLSDRAAGDGIKVIRTISELENFIEVHKGYMNDVTIEDWIGDHIPLSIGYYVVGGEIRHTWFTRQMCQGNSHIGNLIGTNIPGLTAQDEKWLKESTAPIVNHYCENFIFPEGIFVFDAMKNQDGIWLCECNPRKTAGSILEDMRLRTEESHGKQMACISIHIKGKLPNSLEEIEEVIPHLAQWHNNVLVVPSLLPGLQCEEQFLGLSVFAEEYTHAAHILSQTARKLGRDIGHYIP